ncbi:MAG: GTPase HflX [Clostridiales bacterium]|nr:GTPase HflX [Clostridiales bacterium]
MKEIKQKYKDLLQSYIGKIYTKDTLIDEKLLSDICDISRIEKLEIAVISNRKGEILDIRVSDSQSGSVEINIDSHNMRIIHTHPFAPSTLSEKDMLFLQKNNPDYIIAVSVMDNGIGSFDIAYLDSGKICNEHYDYAGYINKYGIMDKINDKIAREKKNATKLIDTKSEKDKAILVAVDIKRSIINMTESVEELKGLCSTDSIEVVGVLTQNKIAPDPKFLLGSGKVEELKDLIAKTDANLVIFENELSSSKQSNLSDYLNVKVIDRSMLILDIFAKRARTNEGKLQVELAQLKYMLPRLKSYVNTSNRYGGGVGMRGPGETKLEMNRRVVEANILKKSAELEKLKKHRELNRKNRQSNTNPTVSIVGYTNSGKSSLLNLLAKDNIYAKDELFATLDTTSRKVWMGKGKEIVFTDTVGFISNLPHEFIEAFSSTLEECIYSDLLLLVIDISNPDYEMQMNVSIDVLQKLGSTVPIIKVYNKVDKVNISDFENKLNDGVVISVKQNIGIENLKNKIIKFFNNK